MPETGHRFPAAILTGLAIAIAVIGGIWLVVMNMKPRTRPLEEALWVCDWEVTTIYPPGSQQQKSILEQFRIMGLSDLKFTAPILYRMGGANAVDPREGILMDPFDPRHPESARALAATIQNQETTKTNKSEMATPRKPSD
jgi:hypothetical protein